MRTHFYVQLSPRGRLVAWGQFDPKHPNLEKEVLISPFAKWAGKQKEGYQRLTDGTDFWMGPAANAAEAVMKCQNCITD